MTRFGHTVDPTDNNSVGEKKLLPFSAQMPTKNAWQLEKKVS